MSSVSKGVKALGIILIIIGIWGFFQNPILGLFLVDPMHNVFHLLTGILAIVFAARGEAPAKQYSKVIGVVYGLLTIAGFFMSGIYELGFMRMNDADDWLHLFFGVAFLYYGYSRVYGARRHGMREAPVRG